MLKVKPVGSIEHLYAQPTFLDIEVKIDIIVDRTSFRLLNRVGQIDIDGIRLVIVGDSHGEDPQLPYLAMTVIAIILPYPPRLDGVYNPHLLLRVINAPRPIAHEEHSGSDQPSVSTDRLNASSQGF